MEALERMDAAPTRVQTCPSSRPNKGWRIAFLSHGGDPGDSRVPCGGRWAEGHSGPCVHAPLGGIQGVQEGVRRGKEAGVSS